MPTILFDFDSTLITCESLEEVLKAKGVKRGLLEELTRQGMEGKIPFLESLRARMQMAPLSAEDFVKFGKIAKELLSPGMEALIFELKNEGVDIWISSSAFNEVIFPVAEKLNIPSDHVIGLNFSGPYLNKLEAVEHLHPRWAFPRILVGDGITDYEIYEEGLVDYFIAYTENVRRDAVIEKGVIEAKSVFELKGEIRRMIDG